MSGIVIGGIVRNREWCVKRWLDSLYDSYKYYRDNSNNPLSATVVIVEDHSTDFTILEITDYDRIQDGVAGTVLPAVYKESGPYVSSRGYSFEHLAYLRNILYQEFVANDADYLFSVDSDILVAEDCLLKLIETGKEIVAAPVRNSANENVLNFLLRNDHYFYRTYTRNIDTLARIMPDYPRKMPTLFEVGLTGACILISKAAHTLLPDRPYGADDTAHVAEDVGFADACYTAGVKQWIRSDIKTIHLYDQNTELVPVHIKA